MKNPPSFQFYPQDFLADLNVQSMTDEEVGMYIKLLCHCWIEDGLPVEGSRVVDLYLKNSSTISKCFYEKDGIFRNKRLDEEREKQRRWREKCSLGGKKSSKNKGNNKGSLSNGQVKANSSLSSLHSSPSALSLKDNESGFHKFWEVYPRKVAKADAFKVWIRITTVGEKQPDGKFTKAIPADIILSVDGYLASIAKLKTEPQFIKHAATFLNAERWRDYLPGAEALKPPPPMKKKTADDILEEMRKESQV